MLRYSKGFAFVPHSSFVRACLLCLCLFLPAFGIGCAGGKVEPIASQEDFYQALEADQPLLVDFYKGGCPTCIIVDGIMDDLAEEYAGRVRVTKYEVMAAYFADLAPEVRSQYDITYFPTVVLFVDGKEYERWVLHYDIDDYRAVLDEVAPPAETAP